MSFNRNSDGKPIVGNDQASLHDIGDGIAYFELHAKLNIIENSTLDILDSALDKVESDFSGMVIGTNAEHFSVGLNLIHLLEHARSNNWTAISKTVRNLQKVCTRLSTSTKPVVAATKGMALGGGCELALGADAVCALNNSQFGLVEQRVGLIPCGCGTTEMVFRSLDGRQTSTSVQKLISHVISKFETIRKAIVSKEAEDALKYGYLCKSDQITTNADNHHNNAKQLALSLWNKGYQTKHPQQIFVLGEEGYRLIELHLQKTYQTDDISEYRQYLAEKLAYVFCGGMLSKPQSVPRQYLLDLEHEVFLGFCGEPKTQAMIESTLNRSKK